MLPHLHPCNPKKVMVSTAIPPKRLIVPRLRQQTITAEQFLWRLSTLWRTVQTFTRDDVVRHKAGNCTQARSNMAFRRT